MSQLTQRGATGPISLVANGAFQTTEDNSILTLVGSKWDTPDGREVALVHVGATAIAAGLLVQGPAIAANHQNLVVTAVQAYSNNGNSPAAVTATLGATAVTANFYAGGYLVVNSGPGIGQTLKIASHRAAAASASLVLTLEDAPTVAITTASRVCLAALKFDNVIVNPTVRTGAQVGVTLYALPANSYGFIVTRGETACLNDAGTAVGLGLMPSAVTAGALATFTAAGGSVVGYASQAGVTTETRIVTVNLA